MLLYLSTLRTNDAYTSLKRAAEDVLRHSGGGEAAIRRIRGMKNNLKSMLIPGSFFEQLGITYFGPIDGYNIDRMVTVFQNARKVRGAVVVHVLTKKGRGYSPAERMPARFHGTGPFEIETGLPAKKKEKADWSDIFSTVMCKEGKRTPNLCAVTAAMPDGTGLKRFSGKYPDRFFDVGIAEEHAVTFSAGLAVGGMIPVFAVYSSFLQRAFDQIVHDVCLQNLHVVFCVDRCGLVGSDGETHHGLFDVSYLRTVPGITILCPADFQELKDMIHTAVYQIDGPVAVRYPRGGEPKDYLPSDKEDQVSENSSVTLVSYGNMFWETRKAKNLLKEKGIEADLIRLKTIEPLDISRITESVRRTGRLIIAEETCRSGCIGEAVIAQLAENASVPCSYRLINLGDGIVTHGSVSELMDLYKINSSSIVSAVEELMQSHG